MVTSKKVGTGKSVQLKDYIYFDAPRMESFLAQLQDGLVKETVESHTGQTGIEAKLAGGIPWLRADLSSSGGVTSVRSTSKVLHNYLYTVLEKELGDRVIETAKVFSTEDWQSDIVHKRLGEKQTDFVKIEGRVRIFDFASMLLQLETVPKMMESFVQMQHASSVTKQAGQGSTKQQTTYPPSGKKEERKAMEAFDQFTTLIKDFYSDFIILKAYPTSDNRYYFIAALDKTCLQDERARLFLKFGSSPLLSWTILAQVASVPQPQPAHDSQFSDLPQSNDGQSADFSDLATAMLDSLRGLFTRTGITISVRYPAISITPLAIYRV